MAYNPRADSVPPITATTLYGRTNIPVEVFKKYDKAGSGVIDLESMRQAFKSLGVSLNLNEAKSFIINQKVDSRGSKTADLSFDYNKFLHLIGADKPRTPAPLDRAALPDSSTQDVQNPRPSPSAAAAIVERLRRERGLLGGEGYLVSLINDDEEPKLKQTVDSSIAKSELERKGGLAAYLSDETEEVVPEGRLPRRPGEKRHKAKQDDRIFTSGQLADMGIGAWIEQEPETPVSPVVQQSAPRPKPVNNSPSAGLLDKTGGIGGWIADAAGELRDHSPGRRHGVDGGGELAGRGGLISYLADMTTDSKAEEGYLPRRPGQEFAKRKEHDKYFHGGELTSAGLGGFISDPDVDAAAAAGVGLNRKGGLRTDETSITFGNEHSGVEEEVPVLPEDVRIDPAALSARFGDEHVSHGIHGEIHRAKSGEITQAGGVTYYVATNPSEYAAPEPATAYPSRLVGSISNAGGLGQYLASDVGPSGEAEFRHTVHPSSNKGTLETSGSIYKFMTESIDAVAPEGYVGMLGASDVVKRRTDLDKALVGTLDKFGGLAGFYSNQSTTQGGSLVPLPGQEFGRQMDTLLLERQAMAGRLEGAGGIGHFMMSAPKPPPGYVTDVDGETLRMAPNDDYPRGELEMVGGLGGYFETMSSVNPADAAAASGLRQRGLVDPLHHYGALAAGSRSFQSADTGSSDDVAVSQHVREVRLVADKVEREQRPLDIPEHDRGEYSLVTMRKQREEAGAPPQREVTMSSIRKQQRIESTVDQREISLLQKRAEIHEQRRVEGLKDVPEGYNEAPQVQQAVQEAPAAPTSPPVKSSYADLHAQRVVSPKLPVAVQPVMSAPRTPATLPAPQQQGLDVRRLARVRKAIRDHLPKKSQAAQSLIKQKLQKEDGDHDGIVSDVEVLRGLTALTPGLAASDVAFLLKYFKEKLPTDPTGPLRGLNVAAISDWITKQPGGQEARYSKDHEEIPLDVPETHAALTGAPPSDRVDWSAKSQKFQSFRNQWEARYGAPAMKELAHDLSMPVEGPSWARADPQPFKVLHLAGGAPLSPRAKA